LRSVEHCPERPHKIGVARILARFGLHEPQLAAPEMVDLAPEANERRNHCVLLVVA
jgi:hypothetical protein